MYVEEGREREREVSTKANGIQSVIKQTHLLITDYTCHPTNTYLQLPFHSYIYTPPYFHLPLPPSTLTHLTDTTMEKIHLPNFSPTLTLTLTLTLFILSFSSATQTLPTKSCSTQDHGSTLQVFHVYSPCSPFKPTKPVSWEESVLQMQAQDQARLNQLLSSKVVARKSVAPIASGRQIVQSPTYIVRANVGTPPQTLLMAVDTSNDAAWIPCNGCVGCSSVVFNSGSSSTFNPLGCDAAQCKQVPLALSLHTSRAVVLFW